MEQTEGPAATGARIRARRLAAGRSQVAVARACAISPSYLLLIEKGRRPIGGALLLRLADALGVPPARLTDGPPRALMAGLRDVPGAEAAGPARPFAEAHPGWAALVAAQSARLRALERQVSDLRDPMARDPRLAAALHEVVGAVAAIRSSAAILAEEGLGENWRRRFARNIEEDGERLSDGAGALTAWLEGMGGAAPAGDPVAAASGWLENLGPEALELGSAEGAPAGAAGAVARAMLARLAADAAALPAATLRRAMAASEDDPAAAAHRLGVPAARVLVRLGILGRPAAGLVIADAAGAPTLVLPPAGMSARLAAAACPLWPLHEARGGGIVADDCAPAGEGGLWSCIAAAETSLPGGLGAPPLTRVVMLLRPAAGVRAGRVVGPGCGRCPAPDCAARREPGPGDRFDSAGPPAA